MEQYVNERDKKYLNKLREEVIPSLPEFCEDFFIGISSVTTVLTRYNYGTDLIAFFNYHVSPGAVFDGMEVCDISLNDLKLI